MAWSAPGASEFSVGQVVTASVMNAKIANNLRYLKGLDGAVTIEDELASIVAAGGTLTAQGTNNASFARLKLLAKTGGGAAIDWRLFANVGTAAEFSIFENAADERLRIMPGGNVGIGNTAPQGKLHVSGPAGGGFMFLSANDVTSIQTIAVAGTVTNGMSAWVFDRNNTSPFAAILGFNGQAFTLGSVPTYANTDTMEVSLTAGGAITVRRSVGTNGSHDINMFVLYW